MPLVTAEKSMKAAFVRRVLAAAKRPVVVAGLEAVDAAPELRALVLGFEEAEQRHGGSGALYVRLRRLREQGP